MIALLCQFIGYKSKSNSSSSQRRHAKSRRRWGRTLLAGESLEHRELLAADTAMNAATNYNTFGGNVAPAAAVAPASTGENPAVVAMIGAAIADKGPPPPENSLHLYGNFGGFSYSDAGPPAPGTSMNPYGNLGNATISDEGPPAPGTSMNPYGDMGSLAASDEGPPAPGTSMNPYGNLDNFPNHR